jgi:hypothetical protein
MMRLRSRIALAAAATLLTACPKTPEPATAYDLPPVTSGGIESMNAPEAVPLTLSVESVDPPDAELAAAVESAIAFSHYADLNACETSGAGWETGFQVGTIGIGFTLEPGGTTRDVAVMLITGDPADSFTACLVGAVATMHLADVGLEEPATFHLMLKYGK